MDKPLARVGRKNHIDNILSRLPMITAMYGAQCYLISRYAENINAGNYALYLGLFLVSFVLSLFAYDKFHHVLIFPDKLHVYSEIFGTSKTILYSEIEEIIAPEQECDFASIIIKLKDESLQVLHFVDYPLQVKQFIENTMNGISNDKIKLSYEDDIAA